METLIIQIDCRSYARDGPPQLGITVEVPYSQRTALQQKKLQQQQQPQDYNTHDYQNLDSDIFKFSSLRSNQTANNYRQNKSNQLDKQLQHHIAIHNKARPIHEGLQITNIQPGSVIDRTGQFRIGDIIVEVNGVNLQRPFPEAQRTLKQYVADHFSHGPLILKVLRKSASSSSMPSTTSSQVTVIEQNAKYFNNPQLVTKTTLTTSSRQAQQPHVSTSISESLSSPKSTSSRTSGNLGGTPNSRKVGVKHKITLKKAVNGFGIKIAARDNMHKTRNRPICITAITTTGSAYQDGRLKEGDMLLEVNGTDLQGKTQSEVTKMLKAIKSNEDVEFVIFRQEDIISDDSQEIQDNSDRATNGLSTENNCDKSLIDLDVPDQNDSVFVEAISDLQFENKIDSLLNVPIIDGPGTYIYDIPLNDTKSAGLGLYLKYPCRSDDRRDLGIWIEKVITGGAAWKDGRLQPDDQILAINGIDLVGLSNAEASETLTAAVCRGIGPDATTNTIRLRIHRRSPSVVAKILQGTNNRIECSDILPSVRSLPVGDKSIDNSRIIYQTTFNNISQDKAIETRNSSGSSNQNSQNDSAMSPQTQASNSLKLVNSRSEKSDQSSNDMTNDTTSSAISQITESTNHVPNGEFLTLDKCTNQKYVSNDYFTTKGNEYPIATKPKSIHTGEDKAEIHNLDHESNTQSWDDESVDASNCEDHFQRDGFGRQSISEKLYAQLNAKNTDTFRKSMRIREEREQQRMLEDQMARQCLDDKANNYYHLDNNQRLPKSYTTNEFESIYGSQAEKAERHQEKTVQREQLVNDYHREVPVDVIMPSKPSNPVSTRKDNIQSVHKLLKLGSRLKKYFRVVRSDVCGQTQLPQQQSQFQQVRPPQPHFSNQQQTPRVELAKQNPPHDWLADEALNNRATKSAVLYANMEHPNLKQDFRSAEERYKQIQKLWRQLPPERRREYTEKARANRTASKVATKPTNDDTNAIKMMDLLAQSQQRQPFPHNNMSVTSQHMHMVPPPHMNQSQEPRWRHSMPVDSQSNRFDQSPRSMHEPSLASEAMSSLVRSMTEPHFDPSPQQMLLSQTPSPQIQFARPPQQNYANQRMSGSMPMQMQQFNNQAPNMSHSMRNPMNVQQMRPQMQQPAYQQSLQYRQPQPTVVSQQYMPNQPAVMRTQVPVKMQHPQHMNYAQSRPQQQQPPSRYQNPVSHDLHPQQLQQHIHQQQTQPISHMPHQPQQQQMQAQIHHHPYQRHHLPQQQQQPQQQMQYSHQQQHNMMYANHPQHGPQMNQPRRQFQPMQQQNYRVSQNYTHSNSTRTPWSRTVCLNGCGCAEPHSVDSYGPVPKVNFGTLL